MADTKTIIADPAFHSLSTDDQLAVLNAQDADFKALPEEEQPMVLKELLNMSPSSSPSPSHSPAPSEPGFVQKAATAFSIPERAGRAFAAGALKKAEGGTMSEALAEGQAAFKPGYQYPTDRPLGQANMPSAMPGLTFPKVVTERSVVNVGAMLGQGVGAAIVGSATGGAGAVAGKVLSKAPAIGTILQYPAVQSLLSAANSGISMVAVGHADEAAKNGTLKLNDILFDGAVGTAIPIMAFTLEGGGNIVKSLVQQLSIGYTTTKREAADILLANREATLKWIKDPEGATNHISSQLEAFQLALAKAKTAAGNAVAKAGADVGFTRDFGTILDEVAGGTRVGPAVAAGNYQVMTKIKDMSVGEFKAFMADPAIPKWQKIAAEDISNTIDKGTELSYLLSLRRQLGNSAEFTKNAANDSSLSISKEVPAAFKSAYDGVNKMIDALDKNGKIRAADDAYSTIMDATTRLYKTFSSPELTQRAFMKMMKSEELGVSTDLKANLKAAGDIVGMDIIKEITPAFAGIEFATSKAQRSAAGSIAEGLGPQAQASAILMSADFAKFTKLLAKGINNPITKSMAQKATEGGQK